MQKPNGGLKCSFNGVKHVNRMVNMSGAMDNVLSVFVTRNYNQSFKKSTSRWKRWILVSSIFWATTIQGRTRPCLWKRQFFKPLFVSTIKSGYIREKNFRITYRFTYLMSRRSGWSHGAVTSWGSSGGAGKSWETGWAGKSGGSWWSLGAIGTSGACHTHRTIRAWGTWWGRWRWGWWWWKRWKWWWWWRRTTYRCTWRGAGSGTSGRTRVRTSFEYTFKIDKLKRKLSLASHAAECINKLGAGKSNFFVQDTERNIPTNYKQQQLTNTKALLSNKTSKEFV